MELPDGPAACRLHSCESPMKALLSVSDRTGLAGLGKSLV